MPSWPLPRSPILTVQWPGHWFPIPPCCAHGSATALRREWLYEFLIIKRRIFHLAVFLHRGHLYENLSHCVIHSWWKHLCSQPLSLAHLSASTRSSWQIAQIWLDLRNPLSTSYFVAIRWLPLVLRMTSLVASMSIIVAIFSVFS